MNTETVYAGLTLKTPIVAASSGLTSNIKMIREMAEAGAGAIVLKSLFEEQINAEGDSLLRGDEYAEAASYIASYVRDHEVGKYLDLIREAKSSVEVPIIASINCQDKTIWTNFGKQIEAAGADAIELNIMRLETDLHKRVDHDRIYVDIVKALVETVKIPVTIKLSRWHTNIPALVDKLRALGAKGVVLFNRAYRTDIDIENEKLISGDIFTAPQDIQDSLRFIAITSALVPNISLAASTGVHGYEGVVKSLLAGASATELCTVLYKEGANAIREAQIGLGQWMQRKGYHSVKEFRGRLNAKDISSATLFERMQFMKYFSRHD